MVKALSFEHCAKGGRGKGFSQIGVTCEAGLEGGSLIEISKRFAGAVSASFQKIIQSRRKAGFCFI